jgi:Ca2+-binding RTX toxin-like protein
VRIGTDLGSDDETGVAGTSSGDAVFDFRDQWVVTDDVDAGGDSAVLHVIGGPDPLSPTSAELSGGRLGFGYDLSLAPGETQIVMHFAAQNPDQATALALGAMLADPDADALAGISDAELARIVNVAVEEPVPVIGSEDDDTLAGTGRNDIIDGRGGDDLIDGLAGGDRLAGGDGKDVVAGGDGSDHLSGGVGDDSLSGGAGDDIVAGDAGRDDLAGGSGSDALTGGQGSDRLLGEEGDDRIEAGEGDDTAAGGAGTDTIVGDVGADHIDGGSGNDSLDGGAGDDRLVGVGNAADAFGSGEADLLTGGAGCDVFVLGDRRHLFYDDRDPEATGEGDCARITDFTGGQDRIELSGAADLYRLDFYMPSAGTLDAALIYDTDEARGELIAIVENVSAEFRLSGPDFVFV